MSFASDEIGLTIGNAEAMAALAADIDSRLETLCEDSLADSPDAGDCSAAREFLYEAAARGDAEGYPVTVVWDDANVQRQVEVSLGNLAECEPDLSGGFRAVQ